MKKNIIYIGVSIIIGMLIGYFLFGNTSGKIAAEDPRHTDEVADQGWTCSMHPQILLHEAGDCPICGMDLTPSDTGTNHLTTDQFRMTENAIALANIQTSIVGKTDFNSEGLKLSGKIKENEKANSVQVTHFSGRIEKLLVNSVGEEVYKGQPIAILYSPELVATQQELLTAATLKKEQPELYEAVRNKLKLRKLSDNQIDQIESSGKIQETFPIYAHVSGVISQKMVEEGNHIVRGQILFKIMNLSTVWATFDAYENQISQLKKGQRIKIKTNAYPNKDFDATITFIDPVLNTKTRTIPVRVVLQNEDAIFKPGMFVEGIVSAAGSIPESKITVPKSSVLWTGERSIVYIKAVSDQPVFEMREVTLGTTEGDAYLILDGLKNGEEIVTNGTFTIDAAAQLKGKKSMMQRGQSIEKLQGIQENKEMFLPINFQQEFVKTLSAYFLLKDALVTDDAANASLFAEQMLKELQSVNTSGLQHIELQHFYVIIKALEEIIKNNDLIHQRNSFVKLNKHLSVLSRNFEKLSNTLYIQQCPMADNNKGAVWLSKEKEIKNPYFGKKMLTCGSVIDTL